jgi:predicted DNA binding CopG/RHH family protein
MKMKVNVYLIVILIHIGYYSVLTENIELSQSEENLLYTHLKDSSNLKLFYKTLIESNGVDQATNVRDKITSEDIEQGTIENKVS